MCDTQLSLRAGCPGSPLNGLFVSSNSSTLSGWGWFHSLWGQGFLSKHIIFLIRFYMYTRAESPPWHSPPWLLLWPIHHRSRSKLILNRFKYIRLFYNFSLFALYAQLTSHWSTQWFSAHLSVAPIVKSASLRDVLPWQSISQQSLSPSVCYFALWKLWADVVSSGLIRLHSLANFSSPFSFPLPINSFPHTQWHHVKATGFVSKSSSNCNKCDLAEHNQLLNGDKRYNIAPVKAHYNCLVNSYY